MRFYQATISSIVISLAQVCSAQETSPKLTVGDPAPALSVTSFLKGEPLKDLQRGQVYVVEFWATWCVPCKVSIPHLTSLQKQYGQKVKVIGVSIWEDKQAYVASFVASQGEQMNYTVASDKGATDAQRGRDGVMARTWLAASGRTGVPTAFIVDVEGRIAWVGHPLEIDEPLSRVVAGTWDISSFREDNQSQWQREARERRFREEVKSLADAGKFEDALAIADEALTENIVPALAWKFNFLTNSLKDERRGLAFLDKYLDHEFFGPPATATKYMFLLNKKKDYDSAYLLLDRSVEGALKDQAWMLHMFASQIVAANSKLPKKGLKVALKAAQRSVAVEKGWENLATLARAYHLNGLKPEAVETIKEAISLAPAQAKAQLESALREYQSS